MNNAKEKHVLVLFIIIFMLLCLYMFIRTLPTIFINKPFHCTFIAAIKVQDLAKKYNYLFFQKQYKSEIEKYIASYTPKAKKEMDKIVLDAHMYCDNYKKNQKNEEQIEEFENKLYDYERSMEFPEFWLYVELSKIQDKYLLIPFGNLPTDWVGAYADILVPYFNKYNIDYTELRVLSKYYAIKIKELKDLYNTINN